MAFSKSTLFYSKIKDYLAKANLDSKKGLWAWLREHV